MVGDIGLILYVKEEKVYRSKVKPKYHKVKKIRWEWEMIRNKKM